MSELPRAAPLPSIHRARGFRLYDTRGRRYLDLDREGALLGHRAATSLTVMKSVLSQGLAGSLPTAWEGRLAQALRRLLPEYPVVRLYFSPERAFRAAGGLVGSALTPDAVIDPGLGMKEAGRCPVAFWRPFLPAASGMRAILPVLPFTVSGVPAVVCAPSGSESGLPDSDTLPGFLLASAVRACAAVERPAGDEPALGNPTVERAIDAASGHWARVGPYVRALFPAERYAGVHAEFMRAGVYLRPVYPGPSVLPGECSPGETKLLADLFARIPGG